MRLFFYLKEGENAPIGEAITSAPHYVARIWHPSLTNWVPEGIPLMPYAVWWLFHQVGIFTNRDYAILLIYFQGMVVHHSCVFPWYFRFPFMAKNDLQVGDTWTHTAHRGKGLALIALEEIVRLCNKPGRRFWYVVEEENVASIRVAEKAGFSKVGQGVRIKRLGLSLLGAYCIQERF